MKYYLILVKKYQTGYSSEYANNIFNLKKACPVCKTGAQVIAPHKLKEIRSGFDKHLFSTYTNEYFISEMLLHHLRDLNLNAESLVKCANQKGDALPFYHLRSDLIMPKCFRQLGFTQYLNHCRTCGRDNYSAVGKDGKRPGEIIPFETEDIELIYPASILAKIGRHDFLFTFECVTKSLLDKEGKIKVLPKPLLIVSERVKDAFINFGIDYTTYWPIVFK